MWFLFLYAGVYRCGFAKSQVAYDEAFKDLFDGLDKVESILSKSRYLAGDSITEADWRLFTTIVRFDPVYVGKTISHTFCLLVFYDVKKYIAILNTVFTCNEFFLVHFKTNLRRITEYPNILGYLRELYQFGNVKDTVNFFHIKNHYYRSHTHINPFGIVAGGFDVDLTAPHNRDSIK